MMPAGRLGAVVDRLRRRLRPPRRLEILRDGKYFLAITLGIGFAALNTGNNLLYLVLGWMLSLIVASGFLSEMTITGIRVTRRPPTRVFAGRPCLVSIAVTNVKRRAPSFSLEIEDLAEGRPLDRKCYFMKVPAGRSQTTSYRHTFPRRGLVRFEGFRLATKYPFALFRKSRVAWEAQSVLVYPAVEAVPIATVGETRRASGTRALLGRRGETFGLRDHREGDDLRDVHWRSSAKRGRRMVRQYEDELTRRVTLLLDNALPPSPTPADEEAQERAISKAASLALAYLAAHYAVRLVARGVHVPSADGPAQEARILGALALMSPATADTPFAGARDPGADNVIVAA